MLYKTKTDFFEAIGAMENDPGVVGKTAKFVGIDPLAELSDNARTDIPRVPASNTNRHGTNDGREISQRSAFSR